MSSSYGPYEWRRHKEYYTEQNGQVVFKEDTPADVLESYRLYQEQIGNLERFATEKGGNHLFSFFKQKEHASSDVQRGLAQRFVENINEGKALPSDWFHFDCLFHDGKGNRFSPDEIPSGKQEYRVVRCVDQGQRSIVFWKTKTHAMITVVNFKENRITQVRQYESVL